MSLFASMHSVTPSTSNSRIPRKLTFPTFLGNRIPDECMTIIIANSYFINFRSKTINLEKLKLRLMHDVDSFDNETKSLSEYRREMELLQQEKMAPVEELRQIHADINAMETVIKQVKCILLFIRGPHIVRLQLPM